MRRAEVHNRTAAWTIVAAMVGAVLGVSAAAAAGDDDAEAPESRVPLMDWRELPMVAVEPETSVVAAGSVETGPFSAHVCFRVEANEPNVLIFVEVTDLYKAGDATHPVVPPIPVDVAAGCEVQPTDADPTDGASPILNYVGRGAEIGAFPTHLTETVSYASTQDGEFLQSVYVVPTWRQDEPSKPRGQYSGKVRMTVMLVPSALPHPAGTP